MPKEATNYSFLIVDLNVFFALMLIISVYRMLTGQHFHFILPFFSRPLSSKDRKHTCDSIATWNIKRALEIFFIFRQHNLAQPTIQLTIYI